MENTGKMIFNATTEKSLYCGMRIRHKLIATNFVKKIGQSWLCQCGWMATMVEKNISNES